ncbi:MAG: ATP-binding protein, partial [Bacteroidota bacterium]
MSIHASRDRNIWFSYWRKGLGRINSKTKEIGQYTVAGDPEIDLKEYHFTCFVENEENHLWVGTSENGLFKFSYKASEDSLYLLDYLQHQLNVPNSLSSNYINCLLLGENGDLWIGTETGLDVIRKGEEKITHILPNEDHKSIRVLSMLEENENLWLSSGDEIFKVARGEGPSKIVQYKDEKMVRNPFQVRAAIRSSSGKLLFGATGGFTLVNPGLIYEDISPPLVNLVSLKVKNKEVLIGEVNEKGRPMITSHISQLPTLDLTHKEDMLSIGFMGIHTAGKEKVSYAYKLDGFNKEWIYVDADDRVATYTNLPYKKLTFMVKARNASGIWSEPKSLTIKVQPPWWLSDWAYACYTLLAIGLLLAIWKIGRMRAEFQHSLELEKVENQKIKEVSRIKQEFYTHLSHELKTPLTLIITPLMKLLETPPETKELTYHHTMMYRNASKLLKMINQLLDIQKKEVGISGLKVTKGSLRKFIHEIYLSFIPLAEPLSIDYSFEANDGEEEVWFDPEELEKVVMNLLSNAFKFTPENGQIKVVVKKDKGKGSWCFSVEDNGVGIESDKLEYVFERFFHANEKSHRKLDKGSGIGLFLSKRIVEAHKGEISVESEAGVGTIFHVSLPVGNSHFTPEELIEDDMHASGMFE